MASASVKAKATTWPLAATGRGPLCRKRMRERRIMLGLSQHQMAGLIGVTYQQAHKYEHGINRIAAGRLFTIAQALGVDVDYFVDGMHGQQSFESTPQQRALLELTRNFIGMPRKHQEAICILARVLTDPGLHANQGTP